MALRRVDAADAGQAIWRESCRVRGLHGLEDLNHTVGGADGRVELVAQVQRLPIGTEAVDDGLLLIRWVAAVARAEHGQEAAIGPLEDLLDAAVAPAREEGAHEAVARREAVLGPLDHTAELRGHEAARLRAGDPEGVFGRGGIQREELGGRGGGPGGAVHGAAVPATGEHVVAVEGVAGADAGFEADDGGEQEVGAGDFEGGVPRAMRERFSGGDEGGEHDGGVVDWGRGVVVVEFGGLDEGGVHH